MNQEIGWYAIRVTYCREMKLKSYLDTLNINNFIPMQYKEVLTEGKRTKKLLPAVHNLIFIQSSRSTLEEVRNRVKRSTPINFLYNKATKMPIVIPEQEMLHFIAISGTHDEQLIYLSEIKTTLKQGERVRVTAGVFAGVEGRVVRIKNDRRVLVAIEGVIAVVTSYINPLLLEKINPQT